MLNASGWWFFTKELENWDLSKLVNINKISYSDEEIEFRESYGERKLITSDLGFWYGPFKVQRPRVVGVDPSQHYIYRTDD